MAADPMQAARPVACAGGVVHARGQPGGGKPPKKSTIVFSRAFVGDMDRRIGRTTTIYHPPLGCHLDISCAKYIIDMLSRPPTRPLAFLLVSLSMLFGDHLFAAGRRTQAGRGTTAGDASDQTIRVLHGYGPIAVARRTGYAFGGGGEDEGNGEWGQGCLLVGVEVDG